MRALVGRRSTFPFARGFARTKVSQVLRSAAGARSPSSGECRLGRLAARKAIGEARQYRSWTALPGVAGGVVTASSALRSSRLRMNRAYARPLRLSVGR